MQNNCDHQTVTISNWVKYYFTTVQVKCSKCRIHIVDEEDAEITIHRIPHMLSFTLATTHIQMDHCFYIRDNMGQKHKYTLRGIVYYGNAHFVSRVIDKD